MKCDEHGYDWVSVTSLAVYMIQLSPVEVGGQSLSQADWSLPDGNKQMSRIRVTSSQVHYFKDTYNRGDFIIHFKADVDFNGFVLFIKIRPKSLTL